MSKKVRETTVIIGEERVGTGKKYKTITDKETGEIIKEYWVEERDKSSGKPPGKRAHFFKVYRTNWLDIIQNKRLTPYETGIFSSLLAFLDWQSPYIVHPQTGENLNESEIAKLISVDRSQLNTTLQSLCEKGLIKKVCGGKGRPNHYMLNTNVVFYGNTIRDLNDHVTFIKDCSYKPIIEMKYKQSQQK